MLRRPFGITVGAVPVVLLLAACSSGGDPGGTATAASSSPSASSTLPGSGFGIEAGAGECVRLTGSADTTVVEAATCGAEPANYRIVDVVTHTDECVPDVNRAFAKTVDGVQVSALCLDYDWVVGGCMDLGGDAPRHVDCGAPAAEGHRVGEILSGSVVVDDCLSPTGGFVYAERRLVVCTEPY